MWLKFHYNNNNLFVYISDMYIRKHAIYVVGSVSDDALRRRVHVRLNNCLTRKLSDAPQ